MTYPLITETTPLKEACERLASETYVTVDTEFVREKTYWPVLCLVQISGENEAFAIDPLAEGIDLNPLYDLMNNKNVLKVFHAAGQDLEIFHHESGTVPAPLFDTQIAAMVCGYGEQIGYANLVKDICKIELDKTSRYTDWAARPLREKQLDYAMGDVTHLRVIYETLRAKLETDGRTSWVAEEMENLEEPSNYYTLPKEAWLRVKPKARGKAYFWKLRAVAAWRETLAQERNVPRGRVLRDDMIAEIAHYDPQTLEEMEQLRGFGNHLRRNERVALIEALAEARGEDIPDDFETPRKKNVPPSLDALMDMLKLCLKVQCSQYHVAPRLVANREDLEHIANGHIEQTACRKGWRHEMFGHYAEEIMRGESVLKYDTETKTLLFA